MPKSPFQAPLVVRLHCLEVDFDCALGKLGSVAWCHKKAKRFIYKNPVTWPIKAINTSQGQLKVVRAKISNDTEETV